MALYMKLPSSNIPMIREKLDHEGYKRVIERTFQLGGVALLQFGEGIDEAELRRVMQYQVVSYEIARFDGEALALHWRDTPVRSRQFESTA